MACSAQKRLSDLVKGWVSVPAGLDCWVGDIQQDSREIRRGALFIAAEGVNTQGSDYIDQAIENGASAIVLPGENSQVYERNNVIFVELPQVRPVTGEIAHRFFGQVTRGMTVVGVTGTNGKSSVTHYIAELATALGTPAAVIGTLGIGKPGALQAGTHTTPDAVSVHRHMARLFEEGNKLVAMEVSSHALDQYRVGGVQFDVAVFTNLTRDHLDYHGTMQAYGEAKQQLFLGEKVQRVINLDDSTGQAWLQEFGAERTLSYSADGASGSATVQALAPQYSQEGIRFSLLVDGQSQAATVPLVGAFNLSNTLAAIAGMLALGYELSTVVSGLCALQAVPGRMERLPTPVSQSDSPVVIVDYAHTPDALSVVLRALRVHCQGALWCVFGCGGDRDPGKRPLMGEIAEALADVVVITDDNPRTEAPEVIIADILKGLSAPEAALVVQPRENAIEYAISHAGTGDIVLLAGKGHEDYQEIKGTRFTFSDSKVASDALLHLSSQNDLENRQVGGWL